MTLIIHDFELSNTHEPYNKLYSIQTAWYTNYNYGIVH